jgi:raffinose/stachyose/melibiose transport system permease protein
MRNKVYPFYFVVGALILYLLFYVAPTIMGFFYAFTDWNSYSTEVNYVGLKNFELIFSSSQGYLHYISNTIIFTVTTIIIKTVIALGLAVLLTQGLKRLAPLYRMVIYLPAVLPMLAVSLIFKSILNPATGLLNTFLRGVGLEFLAQKWLVDPLLALPSVIGVDTWKGVGYIMVILIAGIETIPTEYFEAAAIDGATSWKTFRYITLPMLTPVLAVTTVLNLLYGLKVFDIIFVLTNG